MSAIRFRSYRQFSAQMKERLLPLCKEFGIPISRVHLAMLNVDRHRYAEYRGSVPVYAASMYKLFIAAAVIYEIAKGRLQAHELVTISARNAVDKKREIATDRRRLLRAGDREPVSYLLDFMMTGSSNTAANALMDCLGRRKINRFMRRYGWERSAVTRKFLGKKYIDTGWPKARPTVTRMRDLVELLHLLTTDGLFPRSFSHWLEDLLTFQLDKGKMKAGFGSHIYFAHKTGFHSQKNKKGELVGVTGDCGIVQGPFGTLIVSCVVVLPQEKGGDKFLARVAKIISELTSAQ